MFPGLLTLLINLDRSPERLAVMSERLAAAGLPWQRVPAVEGKLLDLATDSAVSPSLYRQRHGKIMNPAEAGCYLSHVRAFEAFLADPGAQHALILEDDVGFAPDFARVLADLLAAADRWDMVKLSGYHSGTPVGGLPLRGGRRLAVMLSRQTGSAAYIVNRRAAEAYLARLLPMYVPYDHMFDKGWLFRLRVRMVTPLPTQLDWEAPSTIGYAAAQQRRLPWWQRLSTHRYRVGNELRRLAHGLGQWARG